MKINYVLLATGSATLPRVNHAFLHYTTPNTVEREAEQVAATLAKAGYFDFIVYDVSGEDHKMIAEFRVNIPEPVVVTLPKRKVKE